MLYACAVLFFFLSFLSFVTSSSSTGVTSYLSTVINRGLTIQFTFQYTDNNRKKLSQYETEEELLNYLRHQGLVEQFVRFADSKGVKRRNILIQKSYKLLEYLNAFNEGSICLVKILKISFLSKHIVDDVTKEVLLQKFV